MGTTIEAAATGVAVDRPLAKTSLKLTDEAARRCLQQAGRDASELDLLINAGIYHDHHLAEPALAALIQEDVGANPGHPPIGGHGTFSFDVLNGVGGVVTAAQLVDGFMRSGAARLGLVVAGDANPDPAGPRSFPFGRSGAALLLGWRPGKDGFQHFHLQTFPEYEDLFHSEVSWHQPYRRRFPFRPSGRNLLELTEAPAFIERCVDCAAESLRNFSVASRFEAQEFDLLIACGPAPEFGDMLAERVGLSPGVVVHPPVPLRRVHTVQPIAGLETALREGRLQAARRALLVTAGAGISIALAVYQHPGIGA